MATSSFFVVCFLIEASFAIDIFHFRPKDFNFTDQILPAKSTQLISTNSTKNHPSFSPPEIHSVSSRNMTGHVFSSRSYPVKSPTSFGNRSGSVLTSTSASSSSLKRQRRRVTWIPPIQRRRSLEVGTGADRKRFQTVPNRRRQRLANGRFQRSRGINSRNNLRRVSGLTVNNRRIPIPQIPVTNSQPERIRSLPVLRIVLPESNARSNRIRLNQGQIGSWNIFIPHPRIEINPEPESGRIRPNPEPGRVRLNPEPGRMRPDPEPGRVRPNPEPGRLRPNPEPGRMRPDPEPGRVRPNPEPGRLRPNPEPGRMRPDPEPGRVRPNPEPGRLRPNPEPGRMRPDPEPGRVRPNPEPGRLRPNPEPGRMRPDPEPGRVRPNPEPSRMRPEPEPGRMRPNPEPSRMRPEPEPGRVRPNPEPGRVRPNPEPGRMRPDPEPGRVRPNPEPGRLRPNPEPGRMRPDSEPGRVRPNPEPGRLRPNPEPGRMRPDPEPGRVRPNPEPGRLRPNPEPGRMIPDPEPGRVRPNPEPSRMRPEPEPGRMRPNPEPSRMRPDPEPGRMRPNLEPGRIEIKTGGIVPNVEAGGTGTRFISVPEEVEESDFRIPPDSLKLPPRQTDNRFSNGHQFSLKNPMQGQFPQIDWNGPIPWPRQERRHDLQKMQYPLFPWWQKRIWIPSDNSDFQSNGEKGENQTEISNQGESNRGDINVPANSCIVLTANGDCNFYRCFDQRHTCPVDQNFAYNVAFYLCQRTENYLNFFDDQAKKYLRGVKRCQMEALVPIYKTEVPTCSQIEAVGLDILTGGILPPSVSDVSCFFQNGTFCDVMQDPQNVQLLYDLYGGDGYTEYRVFIHFVKLIQKCSPVALESFNQRYAQRFMTFQD